MHKVLNTEMYVFAICCTFSVLLLHKINRCFSLRPKANNNENTLQIRCILVYNFDGRKRSVDTLPPQIIKYMYLWCFRVSWHIINVVRLRYFAMILCVM